MSASGPSGPLVEFIKLVAKKDKMCDKALHFISLINDLIHEHSCKILHIVAFFQGSSMFDKSQNLMKWLN